MKSCLAVLVLGQIGLFVCGSKESFVEEALLRPLPDGRVLFDVHFNINGSSTSSKHTDVFPKVRCIIHAKCSGV